MSALGNRYSCIECETKFYDLGRSQAICPACGTDQAAPEETAAEPVAVAVAAASNPGKDAKSADGDPPDEEE